MADNKIGGEDMAERLRQSAAKLGYSPDTAPNQSSVYDLRNGRYAPSPLVMLLIHDATRGKIGIKAWVPPPTHKPKKRSRTS